MSSINTLSEKQPLYAEDDHHSEKYNPAMFDVFMMMVKDIKFMMKETSRSVGNILDYQRSVYYDLIELNNSPKKNKESLRKNRQIALSSLYYISQQIIKIEPLKPYLSELDTRNHQYKNILKKYKELLDYTINITLDYRRKTCVLFEKWITLVNPQATSFDLDRAVAHTTEGMPSVFVQVLMQRGVQGKETRKLLDMIQHIHADLVESSRVFSSLSELRSNANIAIETYRNRWPMIMKEGDVVYVIDDNLELLQVSTLGAEIDMGHLLRKREINNKLKKTCMVASILMTLAACVLLTVLYFGIT